jgi:hypothetical protein
MTGHARCNRSAVRRSRLWWTCSGKPTSNLQLRGRQHETIACWRASKRAYNEFAERNALNNSAFGIYLPKLTALCSGHLVDSANFSSNPIAICNFCRRFVHPLVQALRKGLHRAKICADLRTCLVLGPASPFLLWRGIRVPHAVLLHESASNLRSLRDRRYKGLAHSTESHRPILDSSGFCPHRSLRAQAVIGHRVRGANLITELSG